MFDGPPETDLEKEEIKEAQKLLAELNLLPKGYSSGVIDSTTEKAEQKMREKLSSFFVEFMVADKDKPKYSAQAKEIQEMLVHFGYLEKGEADGYLGEKSDVRAERFIEKVALEAFKDSPIDMADFVINLISESFSKDSK